MNEEIVNRASGKIDVNDFVTLTKLHKEYKWLSYEPEALFELWCLSDNKDQKDLIEFLIKNFSFVDGQTLNEAGKSIAAQIETNWGLTSESTFLIATCDDKNPDGSQSIIQCLKNKFSMNWKESNFFNSLPIGANEIPDNSNVILTDDFIGTGDTIERKVKYMRSTIEKRQLTNVTVRTISLAAMEFSKDVLDKLYMEYYSVFWLKKGISEIMEAENRPSAKKSMENLESKLKNKIGSRKLPNFGYKRSEALFGFEANNVPNNVFPIFWWPFYKGGIQRKTLFRRI